MILPGETFTWGSGDTVYTLVRTARSYADDLCAAYNAARKRDDVEYFVDTMGNVKLRFTAATIAAFAASGERALAKEQRIALAVQAKAMAGGFVENAAAAREDA